MSTRCRIGIQNENGTISSIYCHHDGYIDGVGKILVNHYKTEDRIRKLLELGDMSSIGTEPVDNPRAWEQVSFTKANPNDWFKAYKEINPDDMCNTYKSRGEDCPAKTHQSLEEYQKCSLDCWGEYTYLFKDGQWYVIEYDNKELWLVQNVLDHPENYYNDED